MNQEQFFDIFDSQISKTADGPLKKLIFILERDKLESDLILFDSRKFKETFAELEYVSTGSVPRFKRK